MDPKLNDPKPSDVDAAGAAAVVAAGADEVSLDAVLVAVAFGVNDQTSSTCTSSDLSVAFHRFLASCSSSGFSPDFARTGACSSATCGVGAHRLPCSFRTNAVRVSLLSVWNPESTRTGATVWKLESAYSIPDELGGVSLGTVSTITVDASDSSTGVSVSALIHAKSLLTKVMSVCFTTGGVTLLRERATAAKVGNLLTRGSAGVEWLVLMGLLLINCVRQGCEGFLSAMLDIDSLLWVHDWALAYTCAF